jgi:hypothetical protein
VPERRGGVGRAGSRNGAGNPRSAGSGGDGPPVLRGGGAAAEGMDSGESRWSFFRGIENGEGEWE